MNEIILDVLCAEIARLRELLAAERELLAAERRESTELRASIQSWKEENTNLAQANRELRVLQSGELLQLFPTYQDAAKHLAALYSNERTLAIKTLRNFTRGVSNYPISLGEAKDMIDQERERLGINAKVAE